EAKMAIYISRKNRVENRNGQEAGLVWVVNLRARLRLEFEYLHHVFISSSSSSSSSHQYVSLMLKLCPLSLCPPHPASSPSPSTHMALQDELEVAQIILSREHAAAAAAAWCL
ncbi:unnamed protein product, partial [Pleuronectes platessa]